MDKNPVPEGAEKIPVVRKEVRPVKAEKAAADSGENDIRNRVRKIMDEYQPMR